ncbi:MAG: DEAD/DEAH box helicase family protein [Bacteroidaceae bacterium]|nr:DEAD/DEAH box helicase family protein [Bacteroidaceae bacterium]
MKIQFKQQQFQLDAVKAVVDSFEGQPKMDSGHTTIEIKSVGGAQALGNGILDIIGYRNRELKIAHSQVLENIKGIQRHSFLAESSQLEQMQGYDNGINLTVEMETGTGKTYTYIRTMYELHKAYGWSKYIIIVPSVAIREGVYKSFQMTESHFVELYGQKVRAFIYNSKHPQDIASFASDNHISVMIINTQAFNSRGKDARRIDMELDQFGSQKPIDIIAQTRPILIIDEPQSVDGKATLESLKKFDFLFTLRYSATHKVDYNKVFRLDALDAYNQKLVKQIEVKGIQMKGITGLSGYLYLDHISVRKGKQPRAYIEFDKRSETTGVVKRVHEYFEAGDSLYDRSGGLPVYEHCVVMSIDEPRKKIEVNNDVLYVNEGCVDKHEDKDFRRIQIRETIKSHLEKERQLYSRGIKVLSLFFIDEVEKYRQYDEDGNEVKGEYAQIFEEEYRKEQSKWLDLFEEDYNKFLQTHPADTAYNGVMPKDYFDYLKRDDAEAVHSGYFSIDKRTHKFKNSKEGDRQDADDESTYELIMKDKERLLSFDVPVRFIFSHSALKEGWDNPNVFQICALKHGEDGNSTVRRRQEVGRGMRLCVNDKGVRQDYDTIGDEVHQVNRLTVIANESYESFARGLQKEISENLKGRMQAITIKTFVNRIVEDANGNKLRITDNQSEKIWKALYKNELIDDDNHITDAGRKAVKDGNIPLPEELQSYSACIANMLERSIAGKLPLNNAADRKSIAPNDKINKEEFKELWNRIKYKTVYEVNYDNEELLNRSVEKLNENMVVTRRTYVMKSGKMKTDATDEELKQGEGFVYEHNETNDVKRSDEEQLESEVAYDLVGELEKRTNLTRRTIGKILSKISANTFGYYAINPEEFIAKATKIIQDVKSSLIIDHITYHRTEDEYDSKVIFSVQSVETKGEALERSIYDYIQTDSSVEAKLIKELDTAKEVKVYTKMPKSFHINTPIASYSPDWAIVFDCNTCKHIYFVAETKGSENESDRRGVENAKIHCWKEHLKALQKGDGDKEVSYHVIKDYDGLLKMAKG